MKQEEIWRDVIGYEGHYQVSNYGNVRSVKREPIILKGDFQRNGYRRVYLWKDGAKKNVLVHRLVALSFLPNPMNYTEINHIDEDKTNNRAENLQWCSHLYNLNYGTVRERIGERNKGRAAWNKGLKCPEITERQLGKPRPHIYSTIGRANTTGVIGVSPTGNGKYQASIGFHKKQIYLGKFENIEDAVKARLNGEFKYYGEKAPQKHLFEKYKIGGIEYDRESESIAC